MSGAKPRIMLVAGEASGDLHGGNLAAALKGLRPDLELFGMGGAAMRRAGVDTLVDIAGVAVVGLWEVVAHFGDIRRAFMTLKGALRDRRPDLVVLIDYPDFNLRLAAEAGRAGVPVVYYVSPQVWAWRRGRVRKIARLVRKMLVLYPFEEEFYRQAGVDCSCVGNPLLDALGEDPGRDALAARFGLDPARPIVGLLPGSRRREVENLLPDMLGAWRLLRGRMPDLQGIIPVAETLKRADLEPYLDSGGGIALVEGDAGAVMHLMDAAVVASGTATLQTALHGKPLVVVYRLSPLTYLLGRMLVKVRHIGLVNIVAGEEVAPELIQGAVTPENIAARLHPLLVDGEERRRAIERIAAVRGKLGPAGASERAAAEVLNVLGA